MRTKKYSKYKCTCGGKLKYLDTRDGDPEGIRNDLTCIKCSQKWGMSKSSLFEIGPPRWKSPEVKEAESWYQFTQWFPEINKNLMSNFLFNKIEITAIDGTIFKYKKDTDN